MHLNGKLSVTKSPNWTTSATVSVRLGDCTLPVLEVFTIGQQGLDFLEDLFGEPFVTTQREASEDYDRNNPPPEYDAEAYEPDTSSGSSSCTLPLTELQMQVLWDAKAEDGISVRKAVHSRPTGETS